jgi:hypothetical protein
MTEINKPLKRKLEELQECEQTSIIKRRITILKKQITRNIFEKVMLDLTNDIWSKILEYLFPMIRRHLYFVSKVFREIIIRNNYSYIEWSYTRYSIPNYPIKQETKNKKGG